MNKYLRYGVVLGILFTVIGCDSSSEKSAKTDQAVETPQAVEVETKDAVPSNDMDDLVSESVIDAEEKAAQVMTDFEDKFQEAAKNMSEEDKAAAMELLGEFQQKMEDEQAAQESLQSR